MKRCPECWQIITTPNPENSIATQLTVDDGTKLGRYEIRAKIGEAGMGEVYRACDEKC